MRLRLRAGARDELGQAMIALRSDDEIDDGRARDDLGAFGLRDAADDGDQRLAPAARRSSLTWRTRPRSE